MNVHRCLVSYVFLKAFDDGTVHPAAQTQKMIFSLQINSYEEILPELTILIERYCGWQCCQFTHIGKKIYLKIYKINILKGNYEWHIVHPNAFIAVNKTPFQDFCL